jgi:hypothetical protein
MATLGNAYTYIFSIAVCLEKQSERLAELRKSHPCLIGNRELFALEQTLNKALAQAADARETLNRAAAAEKARKQAQA